MTVATGSLSELSSAIEGLIADPSLDAAAKLAAFRDIREHLVDLLGRCDEYSGTVDKQREADAAQLAEDLVRVRENATLRDELIHRGEATPEELSEVGFYSHAVLDELEEEGLLEATAVELRKAWDQALHPRERGGRFARTAHHAREKARVEDTALVKEETKEVYKEGGPVTDEFVHRLLADHPRKPHEQLFVYQGRITNDLPPAVKHEVLFRTRERYPPVDFCDKGCRKWRQDHGLPEPRVDIAEVPAPLQKGDKVARAFEMTPDDAKDPKVIAAFDDFKKQNEAMWEFITKPEDQGGMGIKVDFSAHDKGDPYPTARDQAEDVRLHHHITIQSGLGSDHALMTTAEYDRFRAVHDIFGHVAIGGGFDRHGEYEAWLSHMTMYTGPGRDAMSSEYHGVNTALWAGAPGTPGTGKAILLPEQLIRDPWDAKGNLIREAAEPLDGIDKLIKALGLTPRFVAWFERGPLHGKYGPEENDGSSSSPADAANTEG